MTNFDYKSALNQAQQSVRRIYASWDQPYDEYDIQEVVSATIEKVCKYSDSFDPERGSLGGWVYRIAKNCSTDYLAGKTAALKREKPLIDRDSANDDEDFVLSQRDLEMVRDSWTPEREMTSQEDFQKIEKILDILIERDRCIVDSLIYGLSYPEIAKELDMTVSHVRNRVCHIRQRILKALKDAE